MCRKPVSSTFADSIGAGVERAACVGPGGATGGGGGGSGRWLGGWGEGWRIRELAGWLVGWLASWLAGWLGGRSVGRCWRRGSGYGRARGEQRCNVGRGTRDRRRHDIGVGWKNQRLDHRAQERR